MKNTFESSDSDLLFVYGTLRLGFENEFATFLNRHADCLGIGYMKGSKIELGPYPGAFFDEQSNEMVEGDVFQIKNKELVFQVLDEYEGIGVSMDEPDEYVRRLCPVSLKGKAIICWVYLYNR